MLCLLQQHDWFFTDGQFDEEEKVCETTAVALLVQRTENAVNTRAVVYSCPDSFVTLFVCV